MVFQLSRMMVAAVVVRQADLNLWKVEPPIFTLTQVSTTSSHPGNPAAPAKLLKVDMSPVPRAAPSPPGAVHLLLPATMTSLSPRLPSSPPTLSPWRKRMEVEDDTVAEDEMAGGLVAEGSPGLVGWAHESEGREV